MGNSENGIRDTETSATQQAPSACVLVESTSPEVAEGSRATSWFFNTEKYKAPKRSWGLRPFSALNMAIGRAVGVRLQRVAAQRAIMCNEFENEEHHRTYGGPWCRGRDHFNSLVHEGLRPDDYVLDLGCGSLRVGIWLIAFLNASRYFGVDSHYLSLDAAARYEVPLHGLAEKRPRLLHSSTFEIDYFQVTFDVVVAAAVFCHLTAEEQLRALTQIVRSASPRMRLFIYQTGIEAELVSKVGLELERVVVHSKEVFGRTSTAWFIYRLLGRAKT